MSKHSIDMTKGPMGGPLLRFILPLVGGSIFQQLYNTVDFLFVGNVMDKTAAAAVGASSTLITITIGLFSGISVGTSVVAAQSIGSRNTERANKVLHTSVTFGLIGGLILMVLLMLLASPILTLLNTPETVMPQAVTYIRIYIISLPMLVFYNMMAGGMRAEGDSQTPFRVLVICGFLNVAMDALFIIVIPLGVAGVAIATLITQSLSGVLMGFLGSRKNRELRLNFRQLGIDGKVLKDVLRIGLPSGIQTIIITFSNVMVQYYINGFGETAVAAFATYYKVENLCYLPIMAFGQAATTFSGQNTGAKQFRRIRKGTCATCVIGSAVVACIAVLILLFSDTVFGWFMKDREVVANAVRLARISYPFYFIYPVLEVFGGAVRGMGYSLQSMGIIITCLCVIRVSLLAVFSRVIHTLESLASVYPITWACAAVSFSIFFAFVITKKIRANPEPEQA